jgi:hypothetical protein
VRDGERGLLLRRGSEDAPARNGAERQDGQQSMKPSRSMPELTLPQCLVLLMPQECLWLCLLSRIHQPSVLHSSATVHFLSNPKAPRNSLSSRIDLIVHVTMALESCIVRR